MNGFDPEAETEDKQSWMMSQAEWHEQFALNWRETREWLKQHVRQQQPVPPFERRNLKKAGKKK